MDRHIILYPNPQENMRDEQKLSDTIGSMIPVGWEALTATSNCDATRSSSSAGRGSSRLDRNNTSLEVRRAFTVFQLMTILEENRHSFLIVEHDPMLYEDAGEMVEYLINLRRAIEHAQYRVDIDLN